MQLYWGLFYKKGSMIEKGGYEIKSLQINKNVGGKVPGDVIQIKVDKEGTPIDRYWRDRVKDSSIDNCVEFQDIEVQKKKKNNSNKSFQTETK